MRRPRARYRSRLDDLIGIGPKHLPHRNRAKEESAGQGQQQSDA